jgi:uncharacterized repeat protein (TIGR01451 family)
VRSNRAGLLLSACSLAWSPRPQALAPPASPAGGPLFAHQARLQGAPAAAPGQAGASHGFAVAASGDTLVVGADQEDNEAGLDCGAVYVYVRASAGWTLQQKLVPAAGGLGGQRFGYSVAIEGDTLVVGALGDRSAGGFTGTAVVFVRAGGAWTEQQRLVGTDVPAGSGFGYSVALSGDTVVAAPASATTEAGQDAGAAYVFVRSGTSWAQQQKLVASDASPRDFFVNVAIAGDTIVVGADSDDTPAGENTGSAYVFERSGATWTERQHLVPADLAPGMFYGWSIALDAGRLAVGSPGAGGAAYAYQREAGGWEQRQKLLPAAASGRFGWRVSLSADTLAVGDDRGDTAGGPDAGYAAVYARAGGAWALQQTLVAPDAGGGDNLGAVAVAGQELIAGAPLADTDAGQDTGAAYAFTRSGEAWGPGEPLPARVTPGIERFGWSSAVSGDVAVMGAWSEDTAAGVDAGALYVSVRSGAAWSEPVKLVPADAQAFAAFGRAVAVSGDTVLAAAPGAGAVYVFVRAGATWVQQQRLAGPDGFGESVALAGDTAVVGVVPFVGTSGSAHVLVRSGATWSAQATLASDEVGFDGFGTSAAISTDTVVIGAPAYDTPDGGLGAAFVFVRSGTGWTQQQRLLPGDGPDGTTFGDSVSVSGDTVVVGASRADTPAAADTGAAYVFERSSGAWSQQQKLVALDGVRFQAFGKSVSVSGDLALVGASGDIFTGVDPGSAYLFARAAGSWSQQQKLLAPGGSAGDGFGWSVSLAGRTALVGTPFDSTSAGYVAGSAHVFVAPVAADLALGLADTPDPVVGLQALSYSILVTNLGPDVAEGVSVVDTLPPGATFASAAGKGWSCGEAAGLVTCALASLAVGPAPALEVVVTTPPAAGVITNLARVAHPGTDPAASNDTATEATTVQAAPAADLSVAIGDGGVEARWGQPLTWTVTAGNAGPQAAAGAPVASPVPPGVAGVSWTCAASAGSSCPPTGAGEIAAAVSLAPGGAAVFRVTGTVASGVGSIEHAAAISTPAGVHDPDTTQNTATLSTPAGPIQFFAVFPCRMADTRTTHPPALAANGTRTFAVGGVCGVPLDARAAAVVLTVASPGAPGNLRMFPSGQPVPLASAINFVAGRNRANNAVVPLGSGGGLDVRCDMPGSTSSTHLVLDVYGYFR